MNSKFFWSYFNVADELDGGLTLEDLDRQAIAEARTASERHGLPWPPDLAEAEVFLQDHRDELTVSGIEVRDCEICGERVVPIHDEAAEMHRPGETSVFCHAQCGLDQGMEVS